MRALSIRQPWAWLIVHGHKDIENRDWSTTHRGPVLIHASKTAAKGAYREQQALVLEQFGIQVPDLDVIERGGVVGIATITDCVSQHSSPWFIPGGFGFVLGARRPLPFTPYKGGLGWFHIPNDQVE